MNAFEILAYGGQVTAIGLLTVFVALIIIIVCIYIMSGIFRLFTGNKSEKKPAAPAPAPAAAPAPAPAPAPVVEQAPAVEAEEVVTDPQIIAVIAAAIAASDANTRLVVRSVKRVSGWNRAARNESVSRF